jgi:hypothetical protein
MAKESGRPSRSGENDKKNTSLRLDAKTLKALKIIAVENDLSIQKIIEELVQNYIKKKQRK